MQMIHTPVGSAVLMIATPDSDPAFPNSRAHGLVAQEEFARQVMPMVPRKRVALDIGAHIGLWSRYLARNFTNVLAFEPVAENAQCFRKNLEGVSNVWLGEVAVGDVNGHFSFKMPDNGNSGMWRVDALSAYQLDLLSDAAPNNMVRIDDMPLEYVDFIKIDTEGYEGRVLWGGQDTIRRYRPVIVFEDNGVGPKYFGKDWVDPKPILRALGYRPRLNWRKDNVWIPA
jgi:FkbM family methyltransferase